MIIDNDKKKNHNGKCAGYNKIITGEILIIKYSGWEKQFTVYMYTNINKISSNKPVSTLDKFKYMDIDNSRIITIDNKNFNQNVGQRS